MTWFAIDKRLCMADLAQNRMHYAGISCVSNTNETVIDTQDVKVQFVHFNTNDAGRGATPDHTQDHITIEREGDYLIICSVTAVSGGGVATTMELEVMKNNGDSRIGPLHADRRLAGGGGDAGSMTVNGIASLAYGDTVELWVANETNTQNYILEDVTLTVIQMI